VIRYDHAAHEGHAGNPRYEKKFKGVDTSCLACHEVAKTSGAIQTKSFDATCKNCHESNIQDRGLKVFSSDAPDGAITQFVRTQMLGPNARKFSRELSNVGLTPVMAQKAASVMQRGDAAEHVVTVAMESAGWSTDGTALVYQPQGHTDALLRALYSELSSPSTGQSAANTAKAKEAAFAELTDLTEGAGACTKCHALPRELRSGEQQGQEIAWSYLVRKLKIHHVAFDHRTHVSLSDPKRSCATCHQINETADYATYFKKRLSAEQYQSNFAAINPETCGACHNAVAVKNDCQTCHTYHPGEVALRRAN
jgi:hypothetical protein